MDNYLSCDCNHNHADHQPNGPCQALDSYDAPCDCPSYAYGQGPCNCGLVDCDTCVNA